MHARDLLQQLGLNKYEADGYYTLLSEGPLTGYELGKRSTVPLSRSYDVLERLHARGLALRQPGDPPKYAARDYRRFIAEARAASEQTLDSLAQELADMTGPVPGHDFWVVRGRQAILSWLSDKIAGAQESVDLVIPAFATPMVTNALRSAPIAGRRIVVPVDTEQQPVALALIDGHLALAGVLDPAEHCQAVVGENPSLLTLLRTYFAAPSMLSVPTSEEPSTMQPNADWGAWEARKQRRLWDKASHAEIA
jgi:HTH-type transcriptional regulator, sugar sensing transcriptional regulator